MLQTAEATGLEEPQVDRLRTARSLVFYLSPEGQLALWTPKAYFSFHPTALSWLVRFADGASVSEIAPSGGDLVPGVADSVRQLRDLGFLVPESDSAGPAAAGRIQCEEALQVTEDVAGPMAGKLRLSRPLFIMLSSAGQLVLWVPRTNSFREIQPATLVWLREFGRVTTVAEVSRVLGTELGSTDRALLGDLIRNGLIAPIVAPVAKAEASGPAPDRVARTRVEKLVDAGSWVEDGRSSWGTLTGTATIDGRTVAIAAYAPWGDAAFSASQAPLRKVLRIQETALRLRCPMIYLFGAGGPSEAGPTLDSFLGKESWGRVYHNQVLLSGEVPQIGAIFGHCSMPSSFPPALCDVLVLVDGEAFLSIAPPQSVKRWLGETVDAETLGGARMHCTVSGMGDLLASSEEEALNQIRHVLSYLPSHFSQPCPRVDVKAPSGERRLENIIPTHADRPFDVLEAIRAIADDGSILELKPGYAKEMATVFARIDGRTVGIVANNSRFKGGILFPETCEKEARFVSLCDAYGVPLLFLMDCPGYMIGSQVERSGLLRSTGRLYAALVEATVPKISVVVRKAHTGGVYAMCGPFFNPDYFLSLPSARIGVLGSKAAYEWLSAAEKAIPAGPCRDDLTDHIDARCRKEMSPSHLAPPMIIDGLVEFEDLRGELATRFARLEARPSATVERKKHGVVQM